MAPNHRLAHSSSWGPSEKVQSFQILLPLPEPCLVTLLTWLPWTSLLRSVVYTADSRLSRVFSHPNTLKCSEGGDPQPISWIQEMTPVLPWTTRFNLHHSWTWCLMVSRLSDFSCKLWQDMAYATNVSQGSLVTAGGWPLSLFILDNLLNTSWWLDELAQPHSPQCLHRMSSTF